MKNKMKYINKKISSVLFSIFFIVIFSILNFEEYKSFHQDKKNLEENSKQISKKLEDFKLEDIKELNDVQFYYTPYKDLITKITDKIENAKDEIFLEAYMLTEKRIQESLIKSHKKWVSIKVILEKSPYMANNMNNKAYNKLKKAWLDIVWWDKDDYSLNHSKVLLIDELSIISTGNFSYSTFTKNRDFFIFTTDLNIKNKLIENFLNDYSWIKKNIFDENLVFSPNWSRVKFEKLFNNASKDIKMYFQYMKDEQLVNKLIEIKKNKNINISLIIPKTAKDDKNIIKLQKYGIIIKVLPKNKMHAKAILIDNTYLFIWSINFSTYSIDKNREVWILLKNKKIIEKFLNIYEQDIK